MNQSTTMAAWTRAVKVWRREINWTNNTMIGCGPEDGVRCDLSVEGIGG